MRAVDLIFPSDSVIVVAGVPGAGGPQRSGHEPAGRGCGEGWASVQVLDRSRAAGVESLRFVPAFDAVLQAA
jgi:hypothetical protein